MVRVLLIIACVLQASNSAIASDTLADAASRDDVNLAQSLVASCADVNTDMRKNDHGLEIS